MRTVHVRLVTLVALVALGAWLAAAWPAGAADPAAGPAPLVTGRAFDAYLDARIALRQEAPAFAAEVAAADDLTPLRARLEPRLAAHGLTFDQFAQAHRLVARDAGLRGRVEAILDRQAPESGAAASDPDKAPPTGGAILPPGAGPDVGPATGPSRPADPARR